MTIPHFVRKPLALFTLGLGAWALVVFGMDHVFEASTANGIHETLCFFLGGYFLRFVFERRSSDELSNLRKKALEAAWMEAQKSARAARFWKAQAHHIAEQNNLTIGFTWDGSEPKLPL